ncbi:MBL fold metallo-hydrolase [Nonomuraea lactucae]|uniref:MBL fold metallo-hydrolase n=1 Tax=Nonomuraea lactucae TaxID=2249762 RepID=UPI000DE552D5|nr:MBL fold metallo-hydrolase [Nonomuraea lactucae]
MATAFASSTDTHDREDVLEELADGVYALTAGGDPNVGAIEGEDFVVCFDARATPLMARRWIDRLRRHTDKPIRHLVLSHYHAVRTLGASAFEAQNIIAHTETGRLIAERGRQDWDSEFARLPRLFKGHEEIPGLTRPTLTFADHLSIDLGGDRGTLELSWLGRGHTSGDIVAWLPRHRILFAGDLVENGSAVYTGDAYHREWITTTLDRVDRLGPDVLVGGRGHVARSAAEAGAAIASTRAFVSTLLRTVEGVLRRGGSPRDAYQAATEELAPAYGHLPVFRHVMVFDTQRAWEELVGEQPRVWTAARDREVWDHMTG